MNRATTKSPMLSMLTREPPNLIRAILTSRLVSNCFVPAQAMAVHHLPLHKTFIRKHTRLLALLDRHGLVHHSRRRQRTVLLRTARKGRERIGPGTSPMSIRHRNRQTRTTVGASRSGRLHPQHRHLLASQRLNRIRPCDRLMSPLEAPLSHVEASLRPQLVTSIHSRLLQSLKLLRTHQNWLATPSTLVRRLLRTSMEQTHPME